MTTQRNKILTINSGSSSIKFALFNTESYPKRELSGKIDRIGLTDTTLSYDDLLCNVTESRNVGEIDAVSFLADWLDNYVDFATLSAVGHRVVHGLKHHEPELITTTLLRELDELIEFDPEHLPHELKMIRVLQVCHPELIQVACFDTAFHSTMPRIARLIPLPRCYEEMGIQRYGFHGLSYNYITEELSRMTGNVSAKEKIIIAHLGNGASLAAVLDGKSVDTSMGFTPNSGLIMGSRTGDLDPGIATFLMLSQNLQPTEFNILVNQKSGLLGLSGTTSNMKDLLELQHKDIRAAEAVTLFCYQVKKWIGAFAAVLNGVHTLVFCGGIGENAPEIRLRICTGLEFLGIEIEEKENLENALVISKKDSRVIVRVIPTDEELMIAKLVSQKLNNPGNN